jgi:hypothetical protein
MFYYYLLMYPWHYCADLLTSIVSLIVSGLKCLNFERTSQSVCADLLTSIVSLIVSGLKCLNFERTITSPSAEGIQLLAIVGA